VVIPKCFAFLSCSYYYYYLLLCLSFSFVNFFILFCVVCIIFKQKSRDPSLSFSACAFVASSMATTNSYLQEQEQKEHELKKLLLLLLPAGVNFPPNSIRPTLVQSRLYQIAHWPLLLQVNETIMQNVRQKYGGEARNGTQMPLYKTRLGKETVEHYYACE